MILAINFNMLRPVIMSANFDRLVEIMARLRAPGGCPWDREQTHQSIGFQLIEEAYETLKAIEDKNSAHLAEELGDLLLHVVFHAQIAEENNEFHLNDVITGLADKLIRRHPHVFSDVIVKNSQEVIKNWEEIKLTEKKYHSGTSHLDSVPDNLPALFEAFKLAKKAAKIGFDWEGPEQVMAKIDEELVELKQALEQGHPPSIAEELGDVLFSIANLCRHLKVGPEQALRGTNQKFRARFAAMEQSLSRQGQTLADTSTEQLNALWEQAKTRS